MIAAALAAAAAAGVCFGFALRGWFDNVLQRLAIRALTTAVGKERVAQAMAELIAREEAGERSH